MVRTCLPPSAGQTSGGSGVVELRERIELALLLATRPGRSGYHRASRAAHYLGAPLRPRTRPAGSVPRAPCPVSRSSLALPFQAKHQAHPTPQGPTSPHQHAQRPQPHRHSFTHSGPPTSHGAPGPVQQHAKPCCGPPTSPAPNVLNPIATEPPSRSPGHTWARSGGPLGILDGL